MKTLLITYLIVLLQLAAGTPVQQDDAPQLAIDQKELDYLVRFGYLNEQGTRSQVAVVDAIKTFQKFVALPVTGVIDEQTKNIMQLPRCGFPDIVENKLRYFLDSNGGLKKRNLSYYMQNVSSQLDFEETVRYMQLALERWGKAGRLTFTRTYDSNADIISYFANRSHGDGHPFDGMGNTLAHAFSPGTKLQGHIHFDDEEIWEFQNVPSNSGRDFYSAAIHELGHTFGMAHSNVQTAIMFPIYRHVSIFTSLDRDDIMGMYELYSKTPYNDKIVHNTF